MEQCNRPTFNLCEVNASSIRLVAERVEWFFGAENCRGFKDVLKRGGGDLVTAEMKLQVDRAVYAKFGEIFDITEEAETERLWNRAIGLSNSTINYARRIIFSDYEKRATLTSGLTRGFRPSSMLERLMMPKRMIGEVAKFEQGRQIWLAAPCMEVILDEEDTQSGKVLDDAVKYLEANLFTGRKEDAPTLPFFSYHMPGTNELIGVSFAEKPYLPETGLLAKSQNYPVRKLKINHLEAQGANSEIKALFDDREKELESRVVKACVKSLKQGRPVETLPHRGDHLGVRLVVIGDRPLRDGLITYVEELFTRYPGFVRSEPDDVVDSKHAARKIEWRRRNVYLDGLNKPIEVIVEALEDHIAYEFHVGVFDPEKFMHNGQAHVFHKLDVTAEIAPFFWPLKLYGIHLNEEKAAASNEYAARLIRAQTVGNVA